MNIDYNYYTKLQNELNKINDAIINEQLGYKNTFPPEKTFTKPFTKIKKQETIFFILLLMYNQCGGSSYEVRRQYDYNNNQ